MPPCDLCGAESSVVINGFGFCVDHIDDGFRRTIRLVAVLHDAPADDIERIAIGMIEDMIRSDDDE